MKSNRELSLFYFTVGEFKLQTIVEYNPAMGCPSPLNYEEQG
jgi:hypothetical protein